MNEISNDFIAFFINASNSSLRPTYYLAAAIIAAASLYNISLFFIILAVIFPLFPFSTVAHIKFQSLLICFSFLLTRQAEKLFSSLC